MTHQALRRACAFVALTSAVVVTPVLQAAVPTGAGDGLGQPPEPPVALGGKSACPRPEAVWAALETLVPRDQLAREQTRGDGLAPAPTAPQIEILDLGLRYRVIAGGRVREYRDDAHDCEHRARVAAVFVALSLAPAYFGQPPAPPPMTPTVSAPVAPAAPPPDPRDRHSVRVNVGASYVAGLSTDHHAAPGVVLRLGFGPAFWGVVAGAALPLPTDATVNGLRLREFRAPADVGVWAALHGDRVELAGEAGLTAAWVRERAPDLAVSSTQSAVEWGARLGVTLRLSTTSTIAPFATAHVEVVPRPTALWAIPQGHVGRTPVAWVGLAIGASLGW